MHQEHRLAGGRVQRLHVRQRGLTLVEAGDHGTAQPEQLQAEPVPAGVVGRLDELRLLQRTDQPVDRRAWFAEPLAQPCR